MRLTDTRSTYAVRRQRRIASISIGITVLVVAAVALVVMALSATEARDDRSRSEVPASTMDYAVFLGDEYTQGQGASSSDARWVNILAAAEEWEPSNLGKAGTGYLVTSGPAECQREECPNAEEMVPAAVEGSPDVVVVATGYRDLSAFEKDRSDVIQAIRSTYSSLRARLPDARIIAVGPVVTADVTDQTLDLDASVEAAAEDVDATFVSLIDPDVIVPGAALGDELTDEGHAAIAERIADALSAP